jgi:soluble P-type ATPase
MNEKEIIQKLHDFNREMLIAADKRALRIHNQLEDANVRANRKQHHPR